MSLVLFLGGSMGKIWEYGLDIRGKEKGFIC